MAVPIPPLFVLSLTDPRDSWVFGKETELGGFIEPPELEDHAHIVFDSAGRKAKLAVKDYSVVVIGWSDSSDDEEFEPLIRKSLEAYGSPAGDRSKKEMVNALAALLRQEQRGHKFFRRISKRLFRTKSSGGD